MSFLPFLLACGPEQTRVSRTYEHADTTATWPSGAVLDLHGIGGTRVGTTVGYSVAPGQYPVANTSLSGKYTTGAPTFQTHNFTLPCTVTGFPSSVDLVGTGLSGSSLTFSFAGGLIYSDDDPSFGVAFSADTFSLTVNSVTTGGAVTAEYHGSFVVSGEFFNTPLLGGGSAGGGVQFATPVFSYVDGTAATLIVNSVTKTFAGQPANGTMPYTDFNSVGTGATVSGALSIPVGGSITVSYLT